MTPERELAVQADAVGRRRASAQVVADYFELTKPKVQSSSC